MRQVRITCEEESGSIQVIGEINSAKLLTKLKRMYCPLHQTTLAGSIYKNSLALGKSYIRIRNCSRRGEEVPTGPFSHISGDTWLKIVFIRNKWDTLFETTFRTQAKWSKQWHRKTAWFSLLITATKKQEIVTLTYKLLRLAETKCINNLTQLICQNFPDNFTLPLQPNKESSRSYAHENVQFSARNAGFKMGQKWAPNLWFLMLTLSTLHHQFSFGSAISTKLIHQIFIFGLISCQQSSVKRINLRRTHRH